MTAPRVPCPTCGKSILWTPDYPWRPFCSERCRLIDLGEWLVESRRIPAGESLDERDALLDLASRDWESEANGGQSPRPH